LAGAKNKPLTHPALFPQLLLMPVLRATLRLLAFAILTVSYATEILLRLWLARGALAQVEGVFRRWVWLNIRLLGVELEVKGEFPAEHALLLPNHRSYLDVLAFPAHQLVVFVAKIEVSRWPLIGYASRVVQTIFVDRKDPESRRRTREAMRERFEAGYSVVVFPEGTTAQAPEVKPFRPGMFHVAAEGDIPVVPVAIEYAVATDAFVGNDMFLPHFMRTFGKPRTPMRVSLGPVMRDHDSESLRRRVQAWVEQEAATLRDDFLQNPVEQN